jgi:hypothetical protein
VLAITNIHDGNVSSQLYGGKAAGLALLHDNGYAIPDTIAIEACSDAKILDGVAFQTELRTKLTGWDVDGIYEVAVRSSCSIEDGFQESMAGHFDTCIDKMKFENIIANMKKVVSALSKINDASTKMGIIIQKRVDADYSGIIFSSDPTTYSKKSMIINYVSGIAIDLVSGKKTGKEIVVSVQNENCTVKNDVSEIAVNIIASLSQKTKDLERKLNYPIDIEWAVLGTDIYFLQCRPLASITKVKTDLQLVSKKNLRFLSPTLVSHDKIKLRLDAEETGTMISDAYIYIHNSCLANKSPIPVLKRSEYCRGYSAVIIHPQRLSNKVIRSFIGDKSKVYGNVKGCYRHDVRSYPKHENLESCLNKYSQIVSEEYWISATIIQEIFDPLYTGAIQKTVGGYLLEITRGHFLSKGVVPASCYATNDEGQVISRNEVNQQKWYRIIEGQEILCEYDEGDFYRVALFDDMIKYIVDYFKPSLKNRDAVVEFGILQITPSKIQPYLIDFFDSSSTIEYSISDAIKEGVISPGKRTGKIVRLNENESDSMNLHFHSKENENKKGEENIIFFCDKPYISLLSLLRQHSEEKIGFVFSEGSLLCHFAVVLREKNIPAIKVGDIDGYTEGNCTVDADTPGLLGKERLSK